MRAGAGAAADPGDRDGLTSGIGDDHPPRRGRVGFRGDGEIAGLAGGDGADPAQQPRSVGLAGQGRSRAGSHPAARTPAAHRSAWRWGEPARARSSPAPATPAQARSRPGHHPPRPDPTGHPARRRPGTSSRPSSSGASSSRGAGRSSLAPRRSLPGPPSAGTTVRAGTAARVVAARVVAGAAVAGAGRRWGRSRRRGRAGRVGRPERVGWGAGCRSAGRAEPGTGASPAGRSNPAALRARASAFSRANPAAASICGCLSATIVAVWSTSPYSRTSACRSAAWRRCSAPSGSAAITRWRSRSFRSGTVSRPSPGQDLCLHRPGGVLAQHTGGLSDGLGPVQVDDPGGQRGAGGGQPPGQRDPQVSPGPGAVAGQHQRQRDLALRRRGTPAPAARRFRGRSCGRPQQPGP